MPTFITQIITPDSIAGFKSSPDPVKYKTCKAKDCVDGLVHLVDIATGEEYFEDCEPCEGTGKIRIDEQFEPEV